MTRQEIANTAQALQRLQRVRRRVIQNRTAIINNSKAFVRLMLGYKNSMPKQERETISSTAANIVEAVEKGLPMPESGLPEQMQGMLIDFIAKNAMARQAWDEMKERVEKLMVPLATSLPVWKWAAGVRGFGAQSLANIIGETGDLSLYSTPSKVWKRLGVAPPETYKDVTINGVPCVKIPKARRSVLWNVGDCLVKGNRDGKYRTVYTDTKRREFEKAIASGKIVVTAAQSTADSWEKAGLPVPRVTKKVLPLDKAMTVKHIANRAQRKMEKQLVLDLWVEWNKTLC